VRHRVPSHFNWTVPSHTESYYEPDIVNVQNADWKFGEKAQLKDGFV